MSTHVRFSFAIKVLKAEAREWLLEVYRFIDERINTASEGYDEGDYELPKEDLELFWKHLDPCTGISMKEDEFEDKGVVYIYAENSGNVDAACSIVQEYLKRFDPECSVYFPWVEYPDNNRVSEFGGGYAEVTATRVDKHSLAEIIDQRVMAPRAMPEVNG